MLATQDFQNVVKNTPLIAIDFLVHGEGGRLLVGKRTNRPALGFLMVPGGRVYKDESLNMAMSRIFMDEFGFQLDYEDISFLGIYDHIYDEGPFLYSPEITSHYVVIAVNVKLKIDIDNLPKNQHSSYLFLSLDEINERDDVHMFTRQYFSQAPINKFL